MAESSFGPRVRAQPLGSQQDSNFLLVAAGGAVAGAVSRPGADRGLVSFQDALWGQLSG